MKTYIKRLSWWWKKDHLSDLLSYKTHERIHNIRRWWDNTFIAHAWYWFRCHFITKYHIIDLRGQADYEWGWLDRDSALLYACFKCLVDFVEGEQPFENLDELEPDSPMGELRALYEWWKFGRAKEQEGIDQLHATWTEEFNKKWGHVDFLEKLNRKDIGEWHDNHPLFKEWRTRSRAAEDHLEAQLLKLIKYRKYMWT